MDKFGRLKELSFKIINSSKDQIGLTEAERNEFIKILSSEMPSEVNLDIRRIAYSLSRFAISIAIVTIIVFLIGVFSGYISREMAQVFVSLMVIVVGFGAISGRISWGLAALTALLVGLVFLILPYLQPYW